MESNTIKFKPAEDGNAEMKQILSEVYAALTEKGYNPISQLVGYVMSGDPTYITNHNGARSKITRIERDEIVEELFNVYIANEARNRGANT